MARGTEEQEQAVIGNVFPYKDYLTHPAWKVVEQAMRDLETNNDLELQTPSRYVVGYLLQALEQKCLLSSGTTVGAEKNGKTIAVRYSARHSRKAKK